MNDWNRVFILRRLRWPALVLLTGIIALLDQIGVLTWDHAWPLYLILLGVLALAERTALATVPPDSPAPGYPSAGYPAAGYPADPAAPAGRSAPVWSQNPAAQPAQEAPGLVPVSPFTSLEATPTSEELRSEERLEQRDEPRGDEFGREQL